MSVLLIPQQSDFPIERSLIGRTIVKDSLLMIEPVAKHWCVVYPLIHHFLDRGWEVTLSGPSGLEEAVWKKISDSSGIDKYRFVPFGIGSLWPLASRRWTAYSLCMRMYQSKMKRFSLRRFVRDLSVQLITLKLLSRIPKQSLVMLEVHVIGTLTSRSLRSSIFPLKQLEKILTRFLLNRINVVNVLDTTLKEAAERRGFVDKPILIFPPAVYKPHSQKRKSDEEVLRLVSPGRVDLRRRDYSWLKDIPMDVRGKIEVAFVGRAASAEEKRIIASLHDLGYRHPPDLSGDYLSNQRFEELCLRADLMIAPILANIGKRIFGVDTTTAALFDAVRYGKPLLLPEDIKVGEHFRKTVHHYRSNSHLSQILREIVSDNHKLLEMQKGAEENSGNFSREKLDYLDQIAEMGLVGS